LGDEICKRSFLQAEGPNEGKSVLDHVTAMRRNRENNGYLTKAEIRQFKIILLAKRNEISGDVTCMEHETLRKERSDLSNLPFHMADAGTDNYEMENTLGLVDSERKLIGEIDAALGRIENGTYGSCEGNGEPIPRERLEAIPWARYCVACARLLEKGLLRKTETLNSLSYDYGSVEGSSEDEQQFSQRLEKP
jgi:RNA polymerase-binding protein DksA